MKEAPLLLAMLRVVGGVKVEHQLLGGGLDAGNELLHQQFVHALGGGMTGPFLQAAQRGGGDHFPVNTDRGLHGDIQPRCAMVV